MVTQAQQHSGNIMSHSSIKFRRWIVGTSLIIVTLFSGPSKGMQSPPRMTFSRGQADPNVITLTCYNDTTSNLISNALFFRNETLISNNMEPTSGEIVFRISASTEGIYNCGPPYSTIRSNSFSLIAFPENLFIHPRQKPSIALVGQSVQLDCGVPPGALLQYYYVNWVVSAARRSIYQTVFNNLSRKLNDRYSLNPSNLSLIINNVQLEDTSDQYHCVLSVVDPNPMYEQTYTYSATVDYNISLVVLAPPSITDGPFSQTVVVGNRVGFTCTATGSPIPTIIWKHAHTVGERPLLLESDSYNNISTTSMTNKISSTLTFFQTKDFDNGVVTCVARVPPIATYGLQLLPDEAKARLNVLGAFKNIDVRITRQKDVIFDIELKIQIEEPLRLYLEYSDVISGSNYTKVTTGMYTNMTTIHHVEFQSEVKFDIFQVSVALQSTRGIRGPLVPAGQHDKRKQVTPLHEDMIIQQIPVIGGVSAATLVLLIVCVIAIFVALLLILFFKFLKRKTVSGAKCQCIGSTATESKSDHKIV